MNKLLKKLITGVLTAIILGTAVACSDATSQLNNGGNNNSNTDIQSGTTPVSTATVESVKPGNFNIYDYYKDVYGFNKSTALKASYSNGENDFYFTRRTNTTVNATSATYAQYHPFASLAYEEFYFLLQTNQTKDLGYYAIVFGGEWETGTKDALYAVRDAAAEVVQEKSATTSVQYARYSQTYLPVIYNFDFKISGGIQVEERLKEYGLEAAEEYNTDIREDQTTYGSGTSAATTTKLYRDLYLQLSGTEEFASAPSVTGKINSSTNIEESVKKIASPSIVLIKKTQDSSGKVVNDVADYVDLSSNASAKKDDVKNLLNKATASTDDNGNAIAAGFKKFNFFRYIFGSYKQGSGTALRYAYEDGDASGSFTNTVTGEKLNVQYNNLTDENHVYRMVSYAELIHLLQSEGNYLIYFGGSWCHYSRGFLAPLNEFAKTYYVNEIYVFDPRIDGTNNSTNIRNNENGGFFARLYANLISYLGGTDYHSYSFPSTNDYLSNYLLEEGSEGNLISGISDYDLNIGGVKFDRIGVPTLLGYRKGNYNANGVSTPVFGAAATQLAFEEIVAAAEEPHKGVDTPVKVAGGVSYYTNVNYLSVVRTSTSGRIVEYNIIKFFNNFYSGDSTFDLVEADSE